MILILMGVSGSGKTTVGELLAKKLGCGFSDADVFHSEGNIAKMHAGIALNDDDRWPWLAAIRAAIVDYRSKGETHVFTCSALKEVYREKLASPGETDVVFVHLTGTGELLAQRLAQRKGHFFDPHLLQSQIDLLEPPANAIVVDITPTPDEIADEVLRQLAARKI
ncbi:gluconokinase [Amantichitinum ursilacus]|uniref:Gluconokinase n=1 Tax=Amantichitinum ursilacus TaxID=857265 RepID=A0A0N0GN28_9NEIS|nr:gluconokinase [Amantichitinum ursilacus]KPC52070.1 Thermoresistant gluconokinase [Amantichitinum ursilacus]